MKSSRSYDLFPLLLSFLMVVRMEAAALGLSGISNDCQTLLDLKHVLAIGSASPNLSSWNSTVGCCSWVGVNCSKQHSGRVVSLQLGSMGLNGAVPPSLSNLTFLQELDLSGNKLHGDVPPVLGSLRRLQVLDLNNNSLEGVIPETLGQLPNIYHIDLSKNNLIRGIPTSLFNCTNLLHLSLEENNLTGVIPPSIANLSSLAYVNLGFNNLEGIVSPSFASLTFLENLALSGNKLHGTIPPVLGSLRSLQVLFLDKNSLDGVIPETLGQLPNIHDIDLSKNHLIGGIPTSLFNCTHLLYLSLEENNLTGGIPPSIVNLSSLAYVYLGSNKLGGNIPAEIHRLTDLWSFDLLFSNLSGNVPPGLYNLSSLVYLNLGGNNLSGSLPIDFGSYLPHLEAIYLYHNSFQGHIPSSITNASSLVEIDFNDNSFSGILPQNLGGFVNLTKLHLSGNLLEASAPSDWNFIASMSSCHRIEKIDLTDNKFSANLPDSFGNLSSSLQWLRLRYNQITGKLPASIGNLSGLIGLDVEVNLLSGPIPSTFGNLLKLQGLILCNNMLSGSIPPSLGNLVNMNELFLNNNSLSGSIPDRLSSLTKLVVFEVSKNQLSDNIPVGVFGISSLSYKLNLSYNAFVGPLPPEVGKLKNVRALDVSHNRLSGRIPSSLGDCQLLDHLNLQGNYFNGTIPGHLSNLKGIQFLDLSQNQLDGNIPKFLEALPFLQFLNLSFNNFEGEVPTGGIFSNLSAFSIIGNENLCGGDPRLNLKSCSASRNILSKPVLAIIIILSILIPLLVVLWLRLRKTIRGKRSDAYEKMECWYDQLLKLSYDDLVNATDGFSSTNLIGRGAFGSVYKGALQEEMGLVAIKVFNQEVLAASKSFIDECTVLRNIRHRNLVRILSACSTVDFRGNEFKALVYEFVSNGNLDEWLHQEETSGVLNISKKWNLSLSERLNIAIDIAAGLDYLHNQIDRPIVHCDLKPGNILLDDDMSARICDFGISRIIPPDSDLMTSRIKGTIGYMPPESAMGCRITTRWDVYSFGVLLLEMFTGSMPTEMENGMTLHGFVESNFPHHINDILDMKMVSQERYGEISQKTSKCLTAVIGVALICSKVQPSQRIEIREVLKTLEDARKTIIKVDL